MKSNKKKTKIFKENWTKKCRAIESEKKKEKRKTNNKN